MARHGQDAIGAAVRAALYGLLLGASTPALAIAPGAPTPAPSPGVAPAPVVAPTPAGRPTPVPRVAPLAPVAPVAPLAQLPAPLAAREYPETLQGGQRALDAGDVAAAVWIFNRVARAGGPDAQSALYWQAFAEHRAGRHNDALETLHRFEQQYPKSRWSDEAKALQVAAAAAAGKPVAPAGTDEELKLYALDGLMMMDPEKALPILKRFLSGNASPRLKERALFIASQTDMPEANALVLQAARDAANPELQRSAILVLAQTGDEELLRALRDVYRASSDQRVKHAVIDAYMMAGDEELMLEIARGDPDPKTRGRAAEMLGAMGATDALRTLYKQEKDPEVRQRLANGLMIAGEADALLEVARNETNPRARRAAIQMLGAMGEDVPDEVFDGLYRAAKDPQERDAVIDALMVRGSSAQLVGFFRIETDPARKRRILQALTSMDAPEADQLLLEILER